MSDTFSISELAAELAVSEYTAYELVKAGNFETITVGQGRRITKAVQKEETAQPTVEKSEKEQSDQELLLRLLQNPEMATLLKTLAKSL